MCVCNSFLFRLRFLLLGRCCGLIVRDGLPGIRRVAAFRVGGQGRLELVRALVFCHALESSFHCRYMPETAGLRQEEDSQQKNPQKERAYQPCLQCGMVRPFGIVPCCRFNGDGKKKAVLVRDGVSCLVCFHHVLCACGCFLFFFPFPFVRTITSIAACALRKQGRRLLVL